MAVEKGITIVFRAKEAPLKSAINKIRGEAKTLDKELGYIGKSLKFNPSSVALWSQKQKVLTQQIKDTNDRLTEMKRIQANLDNKGIDRNSAEYRELEREIVKCKSRLQELRTELVKVGSARLTALSEAFKQLGSRMTEAGQTLTTKLTVPLTLLGGTAVKKFADVDKTMVLANKTMGNTAEQAELLNDAMEKAAAASVYGMSDAAEAMLNFARAGLSAEQSASALAPAMNLAAGEGGDLNTVSAGLVATINGFHGSFDDAAHYADVFANACNNSALDVNSLSEAMSVAAPIFASAGYSIEDAALYMGVMANNGIEANVAANSLKTGLARLVSPAKDGADEMERLGLSFTNADGSMKDTITIQKELHDTFARLSESEQIAAASAIFGKNQMAPWLALINTAPEDVQALSTELGVLGTTQEMANAQMSGFAGSLEALKSNVDVLMTSLGEALAPTIQKIAGYLQRAVEWFNSLDDSTKQTIATVGLVAAAVGPVLLILGKAFTIIGTVIGAVSKFIGIAKIVVAFLGGPVSLAIAAVIAIIALVITHLDWCKEKIAQFKEWVSTTVTAIKDWVSKTWESLKNAVVNTITNLVNTAKVLWEALKIGIQTIITNISDTVSNVFNGLKNTVTSIFNGIKSTAVSVWNGIKDAIQNPINTAVTFVKNAIDKIKGFFSGLKLELPHIKLPHFKLSGSFSLAPPSVPKLSVDWYKDGAIFNRPTIFPNGVGVGDVAGGEAVLPLKKFWEEMDSRSMGTNITINVNASPGMDINELVKEIERKLITNTKRQNYAWR